LEGLKKGNGNEDWGEEEGMEAVFGCASRRGRVCPGDTFPFTDKASQHNSKAKSPKNLQ